MASVYQAIQRKLERPVAIKILRPKLATDPQLVNRFFHEARAANIIRSPHVIEVYDFVEGGPDVYFVMEFLRGQNLRESIYRYPAPMPIERAAAILEQIAAGLHATHAHQIIHRDIKPENIFLVGRNGSLDFVKVIDYGIAKLDRPDGRLTVEGDVLGTPEYMSPEQARGQAVDGRSDIYSLACVGYEMLAHRPLFRGDAPIDVLSMQINQAPLPLRELRPTIPDELNDLIMRGLSKSPDDRPPTALAFAEELARAVGRELSDEAFIGERSAPARSTPVGLSLRRRSRPYLTGHWRLAAKVGLAAVGASLALGLATAHRPPSVMGVPEAAAVTDPGPISPAAPSPPPMPAASPPPDSSSTAAAPEKPTPAEPRARRRVRPAVTDLRSPETTLDPFAE
jgi:serine/threonine-protein kinase